MQPVDDWFLSADERGNASTSVDDDAEPGTAWTVGNSVEPLVHGATYFARLIACMASLRDGDEVLIADWRGDEDQLLGLDGPRLGNALTELARRGVKIRGILWRSHPQVLGFSQEKAGELARIVNEAGGEMVLDERVRRGGSHHQKLVLLFHPGRPAEDVAFVGGIDLCHGRRDDERHEGDPQSERLDPVYGERPPWHDIQAEVRGPALVQLAETFRERWNDRTPLERRVYRFVRRIAQRTKEPQLPDPFPRLDMTPPPSGRLAVQVLRTYPAKRPGYPFAPDGERSLARLYGKALARARSLIYVQDQYFWSEEIAGLYEAALRREPDLRVIAVVPKHPDHNGIFSGPTSRWGQLAMMDRLLALAPDRVAVYDLENERGDAIYVHSKAVVIDDILAMVGSDNMNRRSWSHDSELTIAVIDEEMDPREPTDLTGRGEGARRFARDLRLRLWREHLGLTSDIGLIDPIEGFRRWQESADALDAWYDQGYLGARPLGRARNHRPSPVAAWQRVWALPAYKLIVDPDGRPRRMRRAHEF